MAILGTRFILSSNNKHYFGIFVVVVVVDDQYLRHVYVYIHICVRTNISNQMYREIEKRGVFFCVLVLNTYSSS